ncbi:NAD(P)-dependent dehydrogenase (short-subunit alcohol dehydrogenase family) [Nocardioides albertanoniae]|uniref:NAD(P)-dependent dehydrogenase (Short-subunit alcohol dehydrogenase family) n=1 Tax=Nocardioides albertanoniae TaxID=1175486 RepID=A0A543A102_9ACTN|nr:SDR family oxidoreductase [Nocardioides albertanoniae]TQL66190.1 NAD(P)-dependent dehydrogenase (short-subunit alcohol dehydrogenase family) [Nocardioides albertanoniae]
MKRTLVTGGTRGIGAAIARRLAADGHSLVLGYLADSEAAASTRDSVRELGAACEIVRADITTDAGIAELFEAAGPITGVVNNAGATYRYAPLVDTPADEIRTTYAVNLVGPTLVARAAVAAMTGAGGVIVNISSGAATLGSPGEYVHYAAAKAGIDALTKGLGLEVASLGIRVVAVAPGLTETDLHASTGDPDRIERMAPQIPLGRASSPDEVAEAVAWLMSEKAGYVTATTLRVAGGR